MKLLVEFSHPAQVHKFKYALTQLHQQGVDILILSRDKDVMIHLLNKLPFKHQCISKARAGILGGMLELLVRELRVLLHVVKFRPNLLLSAHSVAITHIGWLFRIPRLVHEDTEFGTLQQKLYMPFATKILTSTAYYLDWGERQLRIPSLEPLAYLHPNYFTPDSDRLPGYGLTSKTRYAVVRIVAWQAMHDRGHKGAITEKLTEVISLLQANGFDKIVLSSEEKPDGKLPADLISPAASDLHHLLAFASICLSESITVAGESAVLGTPTLLINPLRAGHSLELEKYGLLERSENIDQMMARTRELANDRDAPGKWFRARSQLLRDKSDMTDAIVKIIRYHFVE